MFLICWRLNFWLKWESRSIRNVNLWILSLKSLSLLAHNIYHARPAAFLHKIAKMQLVLVRCIYGGGNRAKIWGIVVGQYVFSQLHVPDLNLLNYQIFLHNTTSTFLMYQKDISNLMLMNKRQKERRWKGRPSLMM